MDIVKTQDPRDTWREHATLAVRRVALELPEFDVTDVWARLDHDGITGKHRRPMGAVLLAAADNGLCEPAGKWTRHADHRGDVVKVMIWRSLICTGVMV